MNNRNHNMFYKIYLFAWVIFGLGVFFWGRMFYIQIVKANYFQEKVTEQRVKEIKEIPERGQIQDRNGAILAMSLMAQDVAVYPNLIQSETHQQKVARVLSDNLYTKDMKKTKEEYYEEILKVVKSNKPWAPIAKRIDPDIVAKIKKEIKDKGLGGIEIKQSPKRYYPNDDLASSILGFVNNENEPGAGIEIGMNSYLAGIPGYTIAETDNLGKVIPIGFENNAPAIDGQDLHLTIDSHIQYILEQRLKQGKKELKAKSVHGIIMDPNTGEIIAMASYPSFNPNKYDKSKPSTWTTNPSTFVYEPGSTFKPIYMANALQSGAINENTEWYDGSGTISVNGTMLRNNNGEVYGKLDLRNIIVHSSNVGMVHISQQIGINDVLTGLKKAGIGQKTGVELPGEEIGLFPTAESLKNDPIRRATVSFGQGISVTPLQLVTAFSEVINGGHKIKAKLVEEATDKTGNVVYKPTPAENERIYSQHVSDLMRSYLKSNMELGSGKDVQLDGYNGGGKTGTAWVVENGVYKSGAIIGSFIGFVPYDHPKYVFFIVVQEPQTQHYGGTSAGPIFHDVATEVLRYKSVPRSDGKKVKSYTLPNLKWLTFKDAEKVLKNVKNDVVVQNKNDGEVVTEQNYKDKNDQLYVMLNTEKIVSEEKGHFKSLNIPNLIGKSKEEVEELFKPYHLEISFHGNGNVVEQSLKPGVYYKKEKLSFWLN